MRVPGWFTSLSSCVVEQLGISTLTTTVWVAHSIEFEYQGYGFMHHVGCQMCQISCAG